MRSLYLLVLLILFSCADDNNTNEVRCEECAAMNLVDTLGSTYLQVSNVLDSIWVTEIDSTNGTSTHYLICDTEPLLNIDNTKIINADGYVFNSCEEEELFLKLQKVSVVETCLPKIDTLQEESDLLGKWYFYEITTGEGSLIPPCESGELGLEIFEVDNKIYLFAKIHAHGGVGGEIQIKDQTITTLYLDQSLILPETKAENDFSRAYCDVLVCENVNVTLEYVIEKNFITITNNTETNSKLKLYKK